MVESPIERWVTLDTTLGRVTVLIKVESLFHRLLGYRDLGHLAAALNAAVGISVNKDRRIA